MRLRQGGSAGIILEMRKKCQFCVTKQKNLAVAIIAGKYCCEKCRPQITNIKKLKSELRLRNSKKKKKTREVHFRVTPQEHAQLKSMAKRIKVSLQDLVSIVLYGRDGRA